MDHPREKRGWTKFLVVAAAVAAVLVGGVRADAGCGCDKLPPPIAPIRPAFAAPSALVTLFSGGLVEGEAYVVQFEGWDSGGGAPEASVVGVATVKRDFADGIPKPQLVVAAPALAPGPAAVIVTPQAGGAPVLAIPSGEFTILQDTLFLDEVQGTTRARCYRAAIGADGTLFLPLNIAAIAEQMIFVGRIGGHRITFGPEDVVIYNTQGVVMQLLGSETGGLYTIDDTVDAEDDSGADEKADSYDDDVDKEWGSDERSFRMTYDRHEFQTYRKRHETDPEFQLDPSDPDWHVNGSRHIDHDHLVMAIRGLVNETTPPAPGVTLPVTFRVTTLFADLVNGPKQNTTIQWSAECGNTPPSNPPAAPRAVPSCNPLPTVGCRKSIKSGEAHLEVRDSAKDTRDTILWKWKKGQATAPGNFGDPTDADGFAVCAYDESGETPVLVFEAGVPTNGGCGGNGEKPCWKGKGSPKGLRGLLYNNRSGRPDGIDRMALKPGANGRAQLAVQGKGKDLELPTLPLPLPLKVQLQSATGQCWEATFGSNGLRKNTDERFQGTSD